MIMVFVSAVGLYADNQKETVKLPLTKLMKEADKLIKKCSKKDPALQQVLIKDAEEQDIDKPRPKVNDLYKGLIDQLRTLEDDLADDTLNKLADTIKDVGFTELDFNSKEGELYDEVEKGKIKERTGVREIIKVKIKTKTEITETNEGTTTETTTETDETSYEEPYEVGDDDDEYDGYDDYEY